MTLTDKLLVAALLLQVALTLGLMLWLGRIRVGLITSREVRMKAIALDSNAWPDRAKQIANAFDNQFQLPVLFYVVVLLSLWRGGSWIDVALAFAFVALRLAHAFIHTTSNHVPRRFFVYIAGLFVLMIHWVWLGLSLVIA
jgi:hypothetical protein